jgi:hypothetical protein
MRFHEKAVKLLLKFISHYSRGGVELPSGLGMLVHALIPSLPLRLERCHLAIEVILTAFSSSGEPTVDLG